MEKTVEIPEKIDLNKDITFEKYRINPSSEIAEPPVIISINCRSVMTTENLTIIIGKAKSGKTLLVGAVVAAFLNNKTQLEKIKGSPLNGKSVSLYIDTEQSTFHATRTIQKICALAGNLNPDNLIAYGLRPMTPTERLAAIDEMISTTENLGLLVIDGVRDLLSIGINDEAEATSLTSKFLKWTAEYNIHLIVLLHQNKNDANARGHIGTELINKAETTISVTKSMADSFTVSCEYSRDVAFEDFAFILEDGLPVACDIPVKGQVKVSAPEKISDKEHTMILAEVFQNSNKLARVPFKEAVCKQFKIGDTKSRDYIDYFVLKKWVKKERNGKSIHYVFNKEDFKTDD